MAYDGDSFCEAYNMECHDESGIFNAADEEQHQWWLEQLKKLWAQLKDLLGIVDNTGDENDTGKEQDCLVSACAKYLTFYWKSTDIERLVPLRSALIDTFGTYDRAWFFLTKDVPIPTKKIGEHL